MEKGKTKCKQTHTAHRTAGKQEHDARIRKGLWLQHFLFWLELLRGLLRKPNCGTPSLRHHPPSGATLSASFAHTLLLPVSMVLKEEGELLSCGSYLAAPVTTECQSQPTQESSLKIASGNNALSTDNVWCSDWSWHEICQVMYASLVLFHCLWKVFIGFLATLFYLVFMYCLFISHLH